MSILDRNTTKAAALIRDRVNRNGWKVYERPYELNIVGIRSDSTVPNAFDDYIYVFWKDDRGDWEIRSYRATTDPGTFWLQNPMIPRGTAILAEGQYPGYQLGLHRGQYKALVQRGPVTIIIDYDRDAILDFMNGERETGSDFGINIHRANLTGTTEVVDRHSAGCQVIADASDYNEFMALADKHSMLYGNNFTYSLIDERAIARTRLRRMAYAVAGAVGLGLLGWGVYMFARSNA